MPIHIYSSSGCLLCDLESQDGYCAYFSIEDITQIFVIQYSYVLNPIICGVFYFCKVLSLYSTIVSTITSVLLQSGYL